MCAAWRGTPFDATLHLGRLLSSGVDWFIDSQSLCCYTRYVLLRSMCAHANQS